MTVSTLHMPQGIGGAQRLTAPFGASIEDIAHAIHGEVDGLSAWLRAPAGHPVEWIEVPRRMWSWIRPKVADCVLFAFRPAGGGMRNIFRTIAAVLITVVAAVVAPWAAGLVGGGLLGSIFGAAVAGGIVLAGNLAINALFPAQQQQQGFANAATQPAQRARQFAAVESDSNLLAKESYLPIVVGARRISPPEIAHPHYYLDNGAQAVNRIFAFDGHHDITDVQVDRAPITDFETITTEVRDGAETTPVTTFVTKVTRPVQASETLSTFALDVTALVDQDQPALSEPQPVRFTTAADPKMEEISIRLQIDTFIKSDSATAAVRVPLRIRFRPKGDGGAWFDLPEIHIVGRDVSTSLKEVRLRWDAAFGEDGAGGAIQYEFFQRVPPAAFPLSDGSTGDQWQADAHFVAGAGLRATANISGRRNSIRVALDPEIYPKQEYEWEIVRGMACAQSALASGTYVIEGAVNSFFKARFTSGNWNVPVDQGAYVGRISAPLATVIVNRQPCQRPKTALVALKARNQSVRGVTAMANRYVHDWDGEGWNTLTTTNNPATHYRQVLRDYLAHHGIDEDLIVNEQFVAWRQECIDRGYEVSAVFAGHSVREVLDAIASAGYARPRFSDGFGIDWFRDRSSERPVQTFSPRNASISVEWVSGEKAMGIRATFQNAERNFVDDEVQINNPFYVNLAGYDVRSYDSIARPDLVERRAFFDILQAFYQQRRAWIVESSIEGLICDRGDLVGIVSDLNDDTNSGARIRKVVDACTFTYDQHIPSQSTTSIFEVENIFDPADIFLTGAQSVVLVSTPNGTEMRTIVAAEPQPEGWMIRVDQPFTSTDIEGAHFVLGPIGRFMSRCIVSEVRRKGEERAQLVLVDEAPEIWRKMQERFA